MSSFSLAETPKLTVTLRLITRGNDQPLSGEGYTVRLFDKDVFDDDFLGESAVDQEGRASISFSYEAFGDMGNLESRPDFYFAVLRSGIQFFQSKVMEDIDIQAIEEFISGKGEQIDLGTFLIDPA
jgi:hypothetical protein